MPRIIQPFRLRLSRTPEFLLILLLFLALPGCVVGDFIGVYFNTYYNVQRLFSEAQDEVWSLPETKASGKNLLVPFVLPGPTKTKLTSVIEKCSKLLQYHPDSRYVDDALLIIAKSYYFQAEYQKTERKCRELIDGFPDSDLLLDTKLILASTEYKLNNTREARELAKEVIERAAASGEDGTAARASLVLAGIERDNKNYDEARKQFERAGELGDNADLRTAAILNAAEMFALIQDFKGAERAFRGAYQASADYVGEYRAAIGIARMLGRQGRYADAIDALSALRANSNYKEFFGEVELEKANTYRDMGDLDLAVGQYRMVDTAYARTEASANSYFQLGLLYETQLSLYDSARVTYNKGRSEFPQSPVTQQLVRRGDYLNRYAQFRGDIARYDSLRLMLLAARDSSAHAPDSISSRQRQASDSLRGYTPRPALSLPPLDTIEARLAAAKNELASLFYATIGRTDSALYWYRRVLEEHPGSSLIARALFTKAQILSLDSTTSRSSVDSLYGEVVRRFPESPFADESRRLLGVPPLQRRPDPAEGMYTRAEILMNDGNVPASIDTLRSLVRFYSLSPLAPKAQYTIGWLYENVSAKPESAFVNYELLVKLYPTSPFSSRVQSKIADPDVRARFAPVPAKADTVSGAPGVQHPADQVAPDKEGRTDVKPGGRTGKQPEEPPGAQERGEEPPKEKKPK